jgi:hypothetical protein
MTQAVTWFDWAGLPESEQMFDRHRQAARAAARSRTAASLRDLALGELLDDEQLQILAGVAADAALRMPPEQADLFGTRGRLVARQWRAMDELRWEVERVRLDQAIHHANGGRHP